jgi:hypothetical protein
MCRFARPIPRGSEPPDASSKCRYSRPQHGGRDVRIAPSGNVRLAAADGILEAPNADGLTLATVVPITRVLEGSMDGRRARHRSAVPGCTCDGERDVRFSRPRTSGGRAAGASGKRRWRMFRRSPTWCPENARPPSRASATDKASPMCAGRGRFRQLRRSVRAMARGDDDRPTGASCWPLLGGSLDGHRQRLGLLVVGGEDEVADHLVRQGDHPNGVVELVDRVTGQGPDPRRTPCRRLGRRRCPSPGPLLARPGRRCGRAC